MLEGRKILLVVTGGISAYKSVYLLRLLRGSGAEVRVLMTGAARNFVAPLTFEVLSENQVPEDMFGGVKDDGGEVKHVQMAQWADAVVVAPATADFMARVASGLGDDLPSTVMIGVKCPVLFAPAMNSNMWTNSIVHKNIEILKDNGYGFISPEEGPLACGDAGAGRMPEPEDILNRLKNMLAPPLLRGVRVVITAGRTEENIDPVRYISNRSSGRMGFALAEEAASRGARVKLICGRSDVSPPGVDSFIQAGSSSEMREAVMAGMGETDVLIMAAAVSDYRPAEKSDAKIKRAEGDVELKLEPTEDILGWVGGNRREEQILVGFALETDDPEENALQKIREKGCDYLVLNVAGDRTGFEVDTNRITLFRGEEKLEATPVISKREAASVILDYLAEDPRIERINKGGEKNGTQESQ